MCTRGLPLRGSRRAPRQQRIVREHRAALVAGNRETWNATGQQIFRPGVVDERVERRRPPVDGALVSVLTVNTRVRFFGKLMPR